LRPNLAPETHPAEVRPPCGAWSTLAGYFEGDGTVEFSVLDPQIHIRLAFDDNWKPFLEGIRLFLLSNGVYPGTVRRKEQSKTYHVVVARIDSVILMAKRMLPYSVKKKQELEIVIEYLEGRLSGRDFVDVMNEEVRRGQRTGKLRPRAAPYRRMKRRTYILEQEPDNRLFHPADGLHSYPSSEEDKKRVSTGSFVGR
jgi:hypothetical protein